MKKMRILVLSLAIVGIALFLSISLVNQARAVKPALPLSPANGESWRTGVTVVNDPIYSLLEGRSLADNAIFRSAKAADYYYIFPAAANSKTIQSAQFYVLNRSGSYAGNVELTLKVYNFSGSLLRTVTSSPVNLKTAVLNAWINIPLSASPGNLVVNPGEFLAFNVYLDLGLGGSLDIRLLFEVQVD